MDVTVTWSKRERGLRGPMTPATREQVEKADNSLADELFGGPGVGRSTSSLSVASASSSSKVRGSVDPWVRTSLAPPVIFDEQAPYRLVCVHSPPNRREAPRRPRGRP